MMSSTAKKFLKQANPKAALNLSQSKRCYAITPKGDKERVVTQQDIDKAKKEMHTVTLIPGDGLGPEIACSVVDLFRAARVPIKWETHLVKGTFVQLDVSAATHFGEEDRSDEGTIQRKRLKLQWDPEVHAPDLHQSIVKNRIVLKGPFVTPVGKGYQSIDKLLALKYDLFSHVVPIKSLSIPESSSFRLPYPQKNLDFVIVRENTEAEYSGLEHSVIPGVVESLKIITKEKSTRIANFAFKYAQERKLESVIAVHKANIMKMGDGLFLKCCRAAAEQNPGIKYKELIVDNTAMQMTLKPEQFNNSVIVTTNLYGSIVSNIAAGLVGGAGVVGGWNSSSDSLAVDQGIKVFEQGARHVGDDIAGRNLANPTGLIRSSIYMLKHLGLYPYAQQLSKAFKSSIADGRRITPDLGGKASTVEFMQDVINRLEPLDKFVTPAQHQ